MSQFNVFEQVIKQISRLEFQSSVYQHGGDKGIRQLSCWDWFGALLFGQLTGHDSIRAIERVFSHGNSRMKKLGFATVCRSTLADANRTRPLAILEDTLAALVKRAQVLAPKNIDLSVKGKVLALDSTMIELCLSLSPWAKHKEDTAAVKLHTAIDLRGDLPEFFVITPGKVNDLIAAKKYFTFKFGSTVVFDRGYWSAEWFGKLNESGVFFVTRSKSNLRFKVSESRKTDRTQGIICDQVVYQRLKKYRYTSCFKGKLRRISYRDPDTNKKLTFITNRWDLTAKQICDLYKARWKVELFFKAMKQNLRIKKFLGTSAHAVKAQILVALIAYVLVQMIRFSLKTNISLPDAMAVIGVLLLINEPLSRLLGNIPRTSRYPPSCQLSFNF